jgi:hypothetical protein
MVRVALYGSACDDSDEQTVGHYLFIKDVWCNR